MRALIIRATNWLHDRSAHRDDQGAVNTAEVLMLTAISAGIIGVIVLPRMEGIVNQVLDNIESALP